MNDYLHKASRLIADHCIENRIGTIVVGHNNGWKNGINLGSVTNQNFVQIPFNKLIRQIQYKAEEVGIEVVVSEESYTSKIDHLAKLDMDKIDVNEDDETMFSQVTNFIELAVMQVYRALNQGSAKH